MEELHTVTNRKLPSDPELLRMRDQGMTHQQIADEVSRRIGQHVARSTVSVAFHRVGEATHKDRYFDTIPWRVSVPHSTGYPLRMLRALARSRRGLPLTTWEQARLDAWLRDLRTRRLVVGFCDDALDAEEAFYYLPDQARDHNDPALPIRRTPACRRQLGLEGANR